MDDENHTVVILPSSLDLSGAEPLCRKLRAKLLDAEPILLDGSQIERISTPCVQILIAAGKSAELRGLRFTLETPSIALSEALTDLGLAHAFAAGARN
jgi:chemotaxis protein CheX